MTTAAPAAVSPRPSAMRAVTDGRAGAASCAGAGRGSTGGQPTGRGGACRSASHWPSVSRVSSPRDPATYGEGERVFGPPQGSYDADWVAAAARSKDPGLPEQTARELAVYAWEHLRAIGRAGRAGGRPPAAGRPPDGRRLARRGGGQGGGRLLRGVRRAPVLTASRRLVAQRGRAGRARERRAAAAGRRRCAGRCGRSPASPRSLMRRADGSTVRSSEPTVRLKSVTAVPRDRPSLSTWAPKVPSRA